MKYLTPFLPSTPATEDTFWCSCRIQPIPPLLLAATLNFIGMTDWDTHCSYITCFPLARQVKFLITDCLSSSAQCFCCWLLWNAWMFHEHSITSKQSEELILDRLEWIPPTGCLKHHSSSDTECSLFEVLASLVVQKAFSWSTAS